MLGILLRCIAAILFLLAGLNETLFHRSPPELVAFGLLAWVIATLVGSWLPTPTFTRTPNAPG
jgi:hypothetical protein